MRHDEESIDFRGAMNIPIWQRAMCEEIGACKVNYTGKLTELPPCKKAVIGAKWVSKINRDETGSVVNHKTRIVAQGCSQRFDVDFTDLYASFTRLQGRST